jgi:PAS domain S-box-containing protein
MQASVLGKLWLSSRLQRIAGPLSLVLVTLFFAIDFAFPLGYSYALFYVIAILVGFFSRSPAWIKATTAASIVVTLLNPLLSALPEAISWQLVAFNRAITVLVCLIAGLVGLEFFKMSSRMREIHEELTNTSSMLQIASRAGKLGGWSVELDTQGISWTDETARILGYRDGHKPDLETIFNHYPPDYQKQLREAVDRCAEEGRPFDLELLMTTLQGERRWVRAIGHAVKDRDGRIVRLHGALQDIQDARNTRLELGRSAERWNQLAEAMPLIVWTATADGELDFFSHYVEGYVKRPIAELLGAGWLELLHPDDRPRAVETWARQLQSREPYELEFRIQNAAGEYEWHLARANFLPSDTGPGKWYGSAMNIHSLKTLQEQAGRLVERLFSIMESVTDSILVIGRDWRITYLNHHAETMLRRRKDELMGKELWVEYADVLGGIFEQQYRACMEKRVPVRFEAWYEPLETLFEVSAWPFDEGIIIYFRDVTIQRRIDEHLQQVQRLESLGQLTGGVAHDFNNLLTVIIGNSEMLCDQLAHNPTLLKQAEMIGNAAQKAAEMTKRLLAFARRQALEPQVSDLNRLVRDLEPLLRRTLGANIEIAIIQSDELWQTLVDPSQLESALLNLAVNARDAMPAGGRLTIETSNIRLEGNEAGQHLVLAPGQYVVLAVSDTGEGIAPELLQRIFEPFFTTRQNESGTGLGLAMVYGFVKQSGGHVTVYSEPGKGTTFRIYLPRHYGNDADREQALTCQLPTAGNGELILLVEDNDLVQNHAAEQLSELGYQVLRASSGAEALDLLHTHPDIALLFTDVIMPGGMSGRELADEALRLRPGLPVLYASGYTENAIMHHGRLEPGVLLLAKPYRRAELASKLRQALAEAEPRAEQ